MNILLRLWMSTTLSQLLSIFLCFYWNKIIIVTIILQHSFVPHGHLGTVCNPPQSGKKKKNALFPHRRRTITTK